MNRIKFLRNKFGYSQESLSRKIGVSKGMIALYENEHRKPSLEILLKLSKVFDVSVDYLLCLTDILEKNSIADNNEYYMCPVYTNTCFKNDSFFQNPIGRIPIDRKIIDLSLSEEYLFFKMYDDSMDYLINMNSYAFIHLQDFVNNNEIALVYVNKQLYLRKIFVQDNNVVLVPISNDDAFSIEIFKLKNVKIIGLYKGKLEI